MAQQETFIPFAVPQAHEMVILSKNLDWNLMQTIAEIHREKVVVSSRGQRPHFRALNGAMVVRTLENSTFRKTEDLIQNYNPARYLCDLQNSHWTRDHVANWEYEGMLGEAGLREMTDYILRTAADLGIADPRGLCSDTTAQEGNIPYPTEKGLGKTVSGKIMGGLSKIAEKVRSHRLFAKTTEAKHEINQDLQNLSENILGQVGDLLSNLDEKKNQIQGQGIRALNNMSEIYQGMSLMMSQISKWIQTGKVAKGKIISLFNTKMRAFNRGKVGKPIEFGLKWGINQIRGGYVSIFMHSKMMCHDANYAVLGVQEHIRFFGEAPKDFGFDRAAWSSKHNQEIRKLGVRNLAIAPKGKAKWEVGPRIKDKLNRERAQIEGKIGTMKRRGLGKCEARINSRVQMSALRAGLSLNLRRLAKDLVTAGATKNRTARS